MKELIERQQKMINILAWDAEFISVTALAEKMNRSVRTTYDDLNAINEWIKSNELPVKLEKKRCLGIRLTGSVEAIRNRSFCREKNSDGIDRESPENRQFMIASAMLIDNETITYQRLMDKYFVSSTSIKNDLEKIQAQYCIKLSSTKRGTSILAEEEEIRKSLFLLAEQLMKNHKLESMEEFERIGPEIFGELFDKELTRYVFRKMAELYDGDEFYFPGHYLKSATLHVLIYLYRTIHGYLLERESNFLFEQIKSIETYYLSNSILAEVSLIHPIKYAKTEIEGLNHLLISQGIKLKEKASKTNRVINESVDKLIRNMSEIFELTFASDNELKERLIFHFIPMIYRVQSGITINNPLMEEIKNQYTLTFNSVRFALTDIETQLQLTFNDDEVSFLTVYFQVALEKMDFGKRILIVCPTGIGTSELIINKVRKMLPQKDSLEVTTLSQLKRNDLSKIDFIISSVAIGAVGKPVVQVSPLISQTDLKNISRLYSEVFLEESADNEMFTEDFTYMADLLDSDYIFFKEDIRDKEACLDFIINKLEKSGDVTAAFRTDVFEREKLGATSLETGVAIPHASPKNVVHSKICVLVLNGEISWDAYKVKVIILICISEKDRKYIKGILSEIYQIVMSREKVFDFVNKLSN
ncbi:PTS sugar transporter subunit IIA [Enterococcus sp. BWT-B8]|uniref:BglG family transcription antiterminator n=1 Tax=unclassified Enterococcus TaxID=2608891 RepID=UPI001E4628D7|nr:MULTISPECIES: PTS sugar transporter subunit IIA [unclassified Enterococcus]MCB5952448.1 PTS sugar transporter subunit IIA [Enterococcus sp. BWT-B8]MCB5955400.1 PTS sugar transporter subunit IIA [Enterococcus sp. CWB-B31]